MIAFRPWLITLLSTYHITGVDDQYDFEKKRFICPEGSQESTHMVEFDHRVKAGNLFYQAWYNQGLRAIDISNPFRPREVGYYISPDFSINVPGQKGRHTREPYPDWDSDLIYVTDGNGGGLTVLRYTGPLPTKPPPRASGEYCGQISKLFAHDIARSNIIAM